MSKILFTGKEIDEAIRRVKAGYADVSKVSATEEDVRNGKVFIDKNKIKRTGTLEDGEAQASLTITGSSYLTTEENAYPVSFKAKGIVSKPGIINSETLIAPKTKVTYIQTEEKTVTAGSESFEVTPSAGKLLSKVTIEKVKAGEGGALSNMGIPAIYGYVSSTTSSSYVHIKIPAGTTISNVYTKPGVDPSNAKLYLLRFSSSSSTTSGGGYVVSQNGVVGAENIRIRPSDILEFDKNSKYTFTGTIEFTSDGILKITPSSDLYLYSRYYKSSSASSEKAPLMVELRGKFYMLICDSVHFTSGENTCGTKVTGGNAYYSSSSTDISENNCLSRNFISAETEIGSVSKICFTCEFDKSGNITSENKLIVGEPIGVTVLKESEPLAAPNLSFNGTNLIWNSVEGATRYNIYAYSDSTSISKTKVTGTSYAASSLTTTSGDYTVVVQGENTEIGGLWSNKITLTI